MHGLTQFGRALTLACAMGVASFAAHAGITNLVGVDGVAVAVNAPLGKYSVPGALATARSTFESGLINVKTEEFTFGAALGSIFGGNGAISGPGQLDNTPLTGGGSFLGRFDTSQDVAATWYETKTSFTINITGGAHAIGFYLTDFGDFFATIDMSLDGGAVHTGVGPFIDGVVVRPGTIEPQALFFGIYSDVTFFSVNFTVSQQDPRGNLDIFGLDGLVVGDLKPGSTDVPEPSSLALVGLALAAGLARRRRS